MDCFLLLLSFPIESNRPPEHDGEAARTLKPHELILKKSKKCLKVIQSFVLNIFSVPIHSIEPLSKLKDILQRREPFSRAYRNRKLIKNSTLNTKTTAIISKMTTQNPKSSSTTCSTLLLSLASPQQLSEMPSFRCGRNKKK